MSDLVTNGKTSLSAEEAIVRAVQYFSTQKWRCTSQSGRTGMTEGHTFKIHLTRTTAH